LQRRFVDPLTQENYVAVVKNLQARRIPFVLVQYPMRDVQALKIMLEERLPVERMIFVDNEQVFQNYHNFYSCHNFIFGSGYNYFLY
jgi:hypothetical protein